MGPRKFIERLSTSADLRLAFRSGVWRFVFILAAGLLIKAFVLDSVKIAGAQMEPAIPAGDRVLLFKTPYTPLLRNRYAVEGIPVVAALPDRSANTALRIAAVSGDTVNIDEGQLYLGGQAVEIFRKDTERDGVIAAAYSPADFMEPYRIPAPGDSLTFGELDQRDLIFAYSVLRQERKNIRLKVSVVKDGETVKDYQIRDFALYSGRLDSIPEEFYADWFFWDRLQGYLDMTAGAEHADGDTGENGNGVADDSGRPRLAFSILRGNREISGFRVKKRYLFLIGDNWTGAKDSRYFGPVIDRNVTGRPFWSVRRFKKIT